MRSGFFYVVLFLLLPLLAMGGCAEVEYASHVAKRAHGTPPPKQEGNFKVGNPYKIDGLWYYPKEQYDLTETGLASWYGPGFHGKKTANGEVFDSSELTAAHRTLQMPSLVRVTNLDNGRSLIVRVNDRGPYKRGRIMDVSEKAAELLGFKNRGTAKVRLQVLRDESLKISQAARSGADLRGYENALNPNVPGGGAPSYQVASYGTAPQVEPMGMGAPGPAPVGREMLATPVQAQPNMAQVIPGHNKGGQFYPDPVVTEYPVTATKMYVQAGAFGVYENAVKMKQALSSLGATEIFTSEVQAGQPLYRVRIGPVSNVGEADELLARVVQSGQSSAIIVVE